MKKTLLLLVCMSLLFAVSAQAQVLTGEADGFGGPIKVSVTVEDGKITAVTVDENSETPSIAEEALKAIPEAIVSANSADVDVVADATFTSEGIMNAVKAAMGEGPAEEAPAALPESDFYIGFGISNAGRIGPGKDDKDVQVYSFNQVYATVIFDKDGKIVQALVDQLEVATPNYDGASMPHFSGYPGQSYNYDENHDEKVDSVLEPTNDTYLEEINGWMTKRQRGTGYRMGSGTWSEQMDKFQEVFVGKTVEEVNAWFEKYCSSANGRPLQATSDKEGDADKYAKLTDEEKAMLADVTTSATMSLNDSHGNILAALQSAFDSRQPLNVK